MNLFESLRVALRGLIGNKMRTGLTMLGIIIGVAVVILVVAIGQGAAKSVTDTINALGTNLLTVLNGQHKTRISPAVAAAAAAGNTTGTSPDKLTLDDARNFAQNFPQTIDA